MSPFELLMLAAMIGAVDVLYFHLYRFRLYERPDSAAEELTHLARHAIFIAIVLAMILQPPFARPLVFGLFALDLLNSTADVLLERRSRASLGGLPSLEYLLHMLATLLSGMAIASLWWAEPSSLSPWQLARGWATVAAGLLLFGVEGGLFVRASLARTSLARAGA